MELFWFVIGFIFGRFGKFILGLAAILIIVGLMAELF